MEINAGSAFKKKANQNKKELISDLESSSEDKDSDSDWVIFPETECQTLPLATSIIRHYWV